LHEFSFLGGVILNPAIKPLPKLLQLCISAFANKGSWHFVVRVEAVFYVAFVAAFAE
jgi:hypothetical protein